MNEDRTENEMNQKKMWVALLVIIPALGFAGSPSEQFNSVVNSAGTSSSQSYKNNVVKNWQAKVADTPQCRRFKDRFKIAGDRYDDALNGGFHMDMMKIWEDVKNAHCVFSA
jgi:hypothetical protein